MAKQSVTITFQDPSGQPLAGGSVTFRLNTDASTMSTTGPQVVAGRLVIATLDSSGSATVLLWPNDQLSPADTIYFVDAYTAQGQPVWREEMTVAAAPPSENFLLQEDGFRFLLEDGTGSILLET